MIIDFTKPVRTKEGHNPVTILTTEGRGDFPILGYIGRSLHLYSWNKDGSTFNSSCPIENVPEKQIRCNKIDFTKPVRTKGGESVKIITTNGLEPYPVIGYRGDVLTKWTEEGFQNRQIIFSSSDLENVPEIFEGYLNIYLDSTNVFWQIHISRDAADKVAANSRIACIKIQYTKGQFDE